MTTDLSSRRAKAYLKVLSSCQIDQVVHAALWHALGGSKLVGHEMLHMISARSAPTCMSTRHANPPTSKLAYMRVTGGLEGAEILRMLNLVVICTNEQQVHA